MPLQGAKARGRGNSRAGRVSGRVGKIPLFGGEIPGKAPEHRRPGGLPDVRGLVTAAGALTAGNPAATLQIKPLRSASGKGGAEASPPDVMRAPERQAIFRGCSD